MQISVRAYFFCKYYRIVTILNLCNISKKRLTRLDTNAKINYGNNNINKIVGGKYVLQKIERIEASSSFEAI